jgi:hypothetical protein
MYRQIYNFFIYILFIFADKDVSRTSRSDSSGEDDSDDDTDDANHNPDNIMPADQVSYKIINQVNRMIK